MSLKNLGSKLASGVLKVKLKREQASPAASKKTVSAIKPLVKQAAKPDAKKPDAPKPDARKTPVSVAAKPVAQRTAQQTADRLERLHPSRIWPD